jgi:hypothetical protein
MGNEIWMRQIQTKYFSSVVGCISLLCVILVCVCLTLFDGVGDKTLMESSFPVEIGFGFVCLLMFQTGTTSSGLFFSAQPGDDSAKSF